MKKILVISNYRGYHTARPEAEIFIGLKKLGFDITIMTYPDAEYIPNFEEVGIKVISKHPEKKHDTEFIKTLKKELKTGKYDLLHLFNNKAIRNGIQAAKNIDVKVVIYRGASANMAWWNPLNYFKFYHPRIDHAICNSEEIRQKFLASQIIHSIKPVTILKGHDLDWYSNTEVHDIRSELSIRTDSLLLVTVANNRKVKGVDVLLKSMKYLPKDANIDLIIIGEKMNKAPIQSLIKNSERADRIHLLGFREDALNIVSGCDVFICPSTGSEALTKSVIEAMSLGVVPVISDIDGNKPLVDNMVNGFVFQNANPRDLADTIMIAYNSRQALPDFSKAAKSKIDRDINSEKTIIKYSEFYISIT